MAKEHKGKSSPTRKPDTNGDHGGNRAGDHNRDGDEPKKSSQAAGKDPHRGEPG